MKQLVHSYPDTHDVMDDLLDLKHFIDKAKDLCSYLEMDAYDPDIHRTLLNATQNLTQLSSDIRGIISKVSLES